MDEYKGESSDKATIRKQQLGPLKESQLLQQAFCANKSGWGASTYALTSLPRGRPIYVYKENDIVSQNILKHHNWEGDVVAEITRALNQPLPAHLGDAYELYRQADLLRFSYLQEVAKGGWSKGTRRGERVAREGRMERVEKRMEEGAVEEGKTEKKKMDKRRVEGKTWGGGGKLKAGGGKEDVQTVSMPSSPGFIALAQKLWHRTPFSDAAAPASSLSSSYLTPPALSPEVFLDVGANVGWFTGLVAEQGFRVRAFEAMATNVRLVRSTICENDKVGLKEGDLLPPALEALRKRLEEETERQAKAKLNAPLDEVKKEKEEKKEKEMEKEDPKRKLQQETIQVENPSLSKEGEDKNPVSSSLASSQLTPWLGKNLFSKLVHLYPFGLGSKRDSCYIISESDNTGDGITKCGVASEAEALKTFNAEVYKIRGSFDIYRMDEIMRRYDMAPYGDGWYIKVMKMDVEGFEGNIMEGMEGLWWHSMLHGGEDGEREKEERKERTSSTRSPISVSTSSSSAQGAKAPQSALASAASLTSSQTLWRLPKILHIVMEFNNVLLSGNMKRPFDIVDRVLALGYKVSLKGLQGPFLDREQLMAKLYTPDHTVDINVNFYCTHRLMLAGAKEVEEEVRAIEDEARRREGREQERKKRRGDE
eukprot:CAMPEP_0175062866 /NCGR_PEP_ID=MMETSP0052_2-20121109/14412_1 /TAXON_ID=51329 ORGANISM="Polytomella parva, Strain SAG 63-3" /NCGR_SAMPLE_ID=MMETSP0052_2 /ASSEMBLY_ACC=CAM_ASM_000194 /LENGTH=650 /DNA_ID=CAMNT_0016328947 /DNA_START=823 /DNA_END=2775 /DNA_ORIENTATION=-